MTANQPPSSSPTSITDSRPSLYHQLTEQLDKNNFLLCSLNNVELENGRHYAENKVMTARIDALQSDVLRTTEENRSLRDQMMAASSASTMNRNPYSSGPLLELQSKWDESEGVVRELQIQNNFLRSQIESMQRSNTTSGGTHASKKNKDPSNVTSPSHLMHTQSSLTKLKARSLDDSHAKFLTAAADLKTICQEWKGKGDHSPSAAATNRLAAEAWQLIEDSTAAIDSVVNRLRKSPLVGESPGRAHGTLGSNGAVTSPLLFPNNEMYYESRYVAVYAECADLRRQLAVLTEQASTWREAGAVQRKSVDRELGHHYQRATQIAEFEANERLSAALLERDVAVEALEQVLHSHQHYPHDGHQHQRQGQLQHQVYQQWQQQGQEQVLFQEDGGSGSGSGSNAGVGGSPVLSPWTCDEHLSPQLRAHIAQLGHELSAHRGRSADLEARLSHLQQLLEHEQLKGAEWEATVDSLHGDIDAACAAAREATAARLQIDNESSHMKLELLRLRKMVAST